MQYLGDYAEDYATLNFKFSTHKADGTPITLSGTPAVKVYKANATDSETATGVTLTVDFDGVTGLNNVKIDLSADAFYATGNDYSVVITTGTVNAISVVGTVVAHFSIENRFTNVTKIGGTAQTAGDVTTVVNLIEDILRNKMTVTDATGAVTLYADDSSTSLLTTTLSDDSTTTTRARLA
jgi:hypothetical protein